MDCRYEVVLFELPASEVSPFLPEGYTVATTGGGTLASVNLNVYRCGGLVAENQTLLTDFTYSLVYVAVNVNETLGGDADANLYLLEIFSHDRALLDIFTSAGFLPITAELGLTETSQASEVSVAVNGTLWYQGTASPGTSRAPAEGVVHRWHYRSATMGSIWVEYEQDLERNGVPGQAVIDVHDGFLSRVDPGDAGSIPGLGALYLVRGTWTFGPNRDQVPAALGSV